MRFLYISLIFLFIGKIQAQQDLMLYHSPNLWHKNTLNPAFFPEGRFLNIGLPSVGMDAAHSGKVQFSDAIITQNGQKFFDFSNLLDKLDDQNNIYLNNRVETISVGFNLPVGFKMSLGHALRTNAQMEYPKALPQLVWQGNAQFIGQTVQIGPKVDMNSTNELALGIAKEVGDLSVGGRIKILTGLGAVRTDRSDATVYTNPDIYQLELSTDYDFYSSGFVDIVDDSDGFNVESGEIPFNLFGSNGGTAFDLGASYNVSEKLQFSASVLDIGGKIKWTENANRFVSKGTFEYDGVTLPGADFITAANGISLDTELDSLGEIFQFSKEENKEFETDMPTRIYLGGSYQLTDKWRFGATAYLEEGNLYDERALGIHAQFTPLRWVALSTMYSLNRKEAANLGFGIAITPGPVQLYAMTDHVLSSFSPQTKGDLNFRFGLALSFRTPKKTVEDAIDAVVD